MKRNIFLGAICALLILCQTSVASALDKSASPQHSGQIQGTLNYCVPGLTGQINAYLPKYSFEARLNQSGEFVFYYVPAGTYSVVFDIPQHSPYRIDNVQVTGQNITDLGTITLCRDLDGDKYTEDADCNDNNPDIHPGATEVCGDGVDNNCNGQVDEGCALCTDADHDGFYAEAGCNTQIDCDDTNNMINPIAPEICNGVDDNCNGLVDEGIDKSTDVNNCGSCGNVCSYPNATAACVSGNCQFSQCVGSYADCNNDQTDGCEVDTANDPNNCGSCGNVCGAGQTCTDGACTTDCLSLNCDDNNACTVDSCDPTSGCVHTPVSDGTSCATCMTCLDGSCDNPFPYGYGSGTECAPCTACNGGGACIMEPDGQDWGNSCPNGGVCDGNGGCKYAP